MVCCTATSSREENSATEPDLLRQAAAELSDSQLVGSSRLVKRGARVQKKSAKSATTLELKAV